MITNSKCYQTIDKNALKKWSQNKKVTTVLCYCLDHRSRRCQMLNGREGVSPNAQWYWPKAVLVETRIQAPTPKGRFDCDVSSLSPRVGSNEW